MKTKILAVILIAIGILMIAYTGFNFITTKKVVDLGPIEINKEENHAVQWPPIAGGMLLLGGIVIMAMDKKTAHQNHAS